MVQVFRTNRVACRTKQTADSEKKRKKNAEKQSTVEGK